MPDYRDAVRFHTGPFHYSSGPAGAPGTHSNPFPPLVAAYLAKRRSWPETTAARALVMARSDVARLRALVMTRSDVARTGGAGFYAPTLRMKFYPGQWAEKEPARRYDRPYYAPDVPAGWREAGKSESILRLRHSGWYTDSDGGAGTIYGFVLQIPARNGCAVYIPAIADTDSDGVTFWPVDMYTAEDGTKEAAEEAAREAARAADGYAERSAAEGRAYRDADSAGQHCGQLRADAARLWADAKAIARAWFADRRVLARHGINASAEPALYARIRESFAGRVAGKLEAAAEAREKADQLAADAPSGGPLAEAFAEGCRAGADHAA